MPIGAAGERAWLALHTLSRPLAGRNGDELVERVLDGRPFESLVSTTFEGLKIAPLYPRVTSEGTRALRQMPGAWKISQRMDHPEPETANAMARADLIGGADALTLTISQAHAARAFGVRIEGERDLDAALAGIDLDLILNAPDSRWKRRAKNLTALPPGRPATRRRPFVPPGLDQHVEDLALGEGSGLIKPTIQERQRYKRRPRSYTPACRSAWRGRSDQSNLVFVARSPTCPSPPFQRRGPS